MALPAALTRIAREHGVHAQQCGLSSAQLRAAVSEYRNLFHPAQRQQLQRARRLALEAMQALADFDPRLFGDLVHGDGALDRISLLVHAESPEQVIMHLYDRHIPWREAEVKLDLGSGQRDRRPALRFRAGDCEVELVVLTDRQRSLALRDPIDGSRLQTLDAAALRQQLDGADQRSSTAT